MLNGPFTSQRHHDWDKNNPEKAHKKDAAAYIWQKIGLFSAFNCVQSFYPRQTEVIVQNDELVCMPNIFYNEEDISDGVL